MIQAIKDHIELLDISDKAEAILQDGLKYLQLEAKTFNVVFLDPPYQSDFITKAVVLLEEKNWLANNAMLYLEIEKRKSLPPLPENWQKLKEKTAGDVSYYLFQRKENLDN